MARWGMVIDLHRCVGCYSCAITCRQEHFLPSNIYFNRVLITEEGKYPAVHKVILPVQCNQCQEAVCIEVCPTGASTMREDGIVQIDSNKCTGCEYCVVACPYQMRTLYSDDKTEFFAKQGLTPYEVLGRKLHPYQKNTVLKCDFCAERIDQGIKQGLKPGKDRDATPACVINCPANARYFGDLDDPESEVSRLIVEKKAEPLHPEFDTKPSIFYIKL